MKKQGLHDDNLPAKAIQISTVLVPATRRGETQQNAKLSTGEKDAVFVFRSAKSLS